MTGDFERAAEALAETGRRLDARGWVLGTSGNLSQVISRSPLRLAITRRAALKGRLVPADILLVDEQGRPSAGDSRPSAETPLHVAIVQAGGAGAVLHTHSVWSTILSDAHAAEGGLALEGFEMLKGLEGVTTHEHCEWVPILANNQDLTRLAAEVRSLLGTHAETHGFLLQRHGLYTWGRDLPEATRHVEILEFLLEVVGRFRI
jgi:methylthioribulose-1-phosphate dehydratase